VNSDPELHSLDLFDALSELLAAAGNVQAASDATLAAAIDLCAAQLGTLHVPANQGLALVAQRGFPSADLVGIEAELTRVDSTAHISARTLENALVEDLADMPERAESALADRYGYRAAQSVCLVDAERKLVCVVTLYFSSPSKLATRQLRWVGVFARQLSLLIRRAYDNQKIAATDERFRSLFQESNDFIVMADLKQKITYCNPATAAALGWPAEYVIGRSIADFIPPQHFGRSSSMLEQKLREGGSTRYEVDVIARDGRCMNWEIDSRLTFGPDGKPTGLHAIGRDMTSNRQAHEELRVSERRLREADQRKDEFLAMLAHELRNPLAPIRTAAYVFKQPRASAEQLQEASSILERQVEHITRIVDDLLDVSRVTRGLVAFDMKPTDLHNVVSMAVEQVRPLMEAKHHRLKIAVPSDPIVLAGEAARLVQMIANLLSNAARHSGNDLDIDLSVITTAQLVEIHVSDRGAGITPDFLPYIFDLFAQSERSAARSEGGLGIGLALVRRIAELHGGSVEARSDGVGRGAHFIVVLPRLNEKPPIDGPHEHVSDGTVPERLRIIVVDDNEDAANTLSMLLQLEGHTTVVAYDALSALERADIERPDVMLLDIGLPGMSGYELAKRLRASPKTASVTLVALTGYSRSADRHQSREAGFDHHLTKPAGMDELRTILRVRKPGH